MAVMHGVTADLVITKETYKGNEVVILDDDVRPTTKAEIPYIRKGQFRLMDLPAELRVYIYQFFLPHNMVMKFREKDNPSYHAQYEASRAQAYAEYQPEWDVIVTSKHEEKAAEAASLVAQNSADIHVHGRGLGRRVFKRRLPPKSIPNHIQTQIFLISKAVSLEARAVLYGSNTYTFKVDSSAHLPVSMKSPRIFGPFGDADRLPLLRNLRSIHININLNDHTHWSVKRQRARLEYFVSILKQHSDDTHKKSLLQDLKVTFGKLHRTLHNARYHPRPLVTAPAHRREEKYMFGLESLTALRGIKDVEIQGVPEWYAKCLELCISGKGGEVKETEWPVVQVTRKKKTVGQKGRTAWVTSRQWWQPVVDWREYAERNGVEVPGDVERFWVGED